MIFTNSKSIKKEKGFTLIEVLIVIGISGIITLFAGTNLLGFQKSTSLRTTADELVANMQKVQSLSVSAKGNFAYGIHFDSSYYEIFIGTTYNPSSPDNVRINLPNGIALQNVQFSPSGDIVFEKLTGYPDYSGALDVVLGSEKVTVTVNSLGVINILSSGTVEIPTAFSLTSPANGSTENSTRLPAFDWTDSSGMGITYTLWHSTDSSFTTSTIVNAGPFSQVTLPSGKELADNLRNYWKVKATNSSGFSKWSTQTWYLDVSVSQPPTAFNLISPVDNETVTTATPTLDWGDSSDPDGGSVTYKLFVDNDSNFSSPVISRMGLASSTYNVLAGDGLVVGQTYYWKVVSVDDEGSEITSTQTDWKFNIFVNSTPTTFNLLTPASGTINYSGLPSFDWGDSSDPDGGAVSYTLWIDDNSDFSSLILEKTNLGSSNYTLLSGEALSAGTYYWKVQAFDDENSTTWSNQQNWNFIVELNLAPGAFHLLTPTSGSSVNSTEIVFDWENSIDPNPLDTVTYTLVIDNNSNFSSPEVTKTGLTVSNYTTVGTDNISNNTTYYWKVTATDGTLTTTSTETNWNFLVSADIYVDQSRPTSGDGTSWARAFKTVTEGVNVLTGGRTVNIATGNYIETVTVTTVHSGTSLQKTKFVERTGDNVMIGGISNREALHINGTEYIEFYGINFADTINDHGAEIRNGAYQVLFDGCNFTNNSVDGIYSPDSANSYITIKNGTISGNGGSGINIYGSYYTIDNMSISNSNNIGINLNSTTNSEVKNCNVTSSGDYGISTSLGSLLNIHDCIITSSGRRLSRDGFYLYRSIGVNFHHNTISGSSRSGIYLSDMDRGITTQSPSTIHHNIAYSNSVDGLYAATPYRGYVYNNTLYGHTTSSSHGVYLNGSFNGSFIVRNNNITGNRYGLRVRSGNANLSHNYANIWGNTTNYRDQGSTYAGANTISVDPRFVNAGAGDFHLQATSGCINMGDPSAFYNDPDGTRADINALHYAP